MSENYNFLHDEAYKQNPLMNRLLPCPFCGQEIESESPDAIYPLQIIPDADDKVMYRAGCIESHGGCGAEVVGWSAAEAIKLWNTRVK